MNYGLGEVTSSFIPLDIRGREKGMLSDNG